MTMKIDGNPEAVLRAVHGMPSVRRAYRIKRLTIVEFKGKLDNPMGMFDLIQRRARHRRR